MAATEANIMSGRDPRGDLSSYPHHEIIEHVNFLHEQALIARENSPMAPQIEANQQRELTLLLTGLHDFQQRLETRGARKVLKRVKRKLIAGDKVSKALGIIDPTARAANRDKQFATRAGIFDIDGSTTNMRAAHVNLHKSNITALDVGRGDYLLKHLPTSKFAEKELAVRGRRAFPEVYVKHWQQYVRKDPWLFEDAGSHPDVVLRDGVLEFSDHARKEKWRIGVLSANFGPFVRKVVERANFPARPEDVWAVEQDSIIAIDKESVLRWEAIQHPNEARYYVGDGSSDMETVHAKDTIVAYFALKDSAFEEKLEELSQTDDSIIYFTYSSFTDIQVKLDEIHALAHGQKAA